MAIKTVRDNSCKIAQYECLGDVWIHSKNPEKKCNDLFSESQKWTQSLQLRLRAADSALENASKIGWRKSKFCRKLNL